MTAKHLKRVMLLLPVMVIAMMISCGTTVFAGTFLNSTDDVQVTNETSYLVISGVSEGVVTLRSSAGTSTAHVILVAPNAKAKFKATVPGYYKSGSTKATRKTIAENWTDSSWKWKGVSDICAEYASAGDTSSKPVLAAINGDFYGYDQGRAPRGTLVLEGNRMAHSKAESDEYMVGLKNNGFIKIFQNNTWQESITEEGICAPFWILRDNEKNMSGVSNDGPEKRTGFATKPDGTAMMIVVESPGVSISQLSDLMKASGFNNGVNFDGGRSITFLSKRSGESLSRKSTMYYQENGTYMERPTASALMLVADDSSVANTVPSVGSGTTLNTNKTMYAQGEPIYVTASTDVSGAWVGIYKAGETPGSGGPTSYFWYYINGKDGSDNGVRTWVNGDTYDICSDGVCSKRESVNSAFDLAPGEYRVVALKGNYEIITEKQITITEPTVDPETKYEVQTDKDTYQVGETIKFKATAPVGHTWVGLYLKGDVIPNDMSFFWYDLYATDQNKWNVLNVNGGKVTEQDRHTSTVTHTIGTDLPAGEYEAILFTDYSANAYEVQDRYGFTIYDENTDFNITYKNGEETLTGLTPATYRYSATNAVNLPAEVQVDGYDFSGWYSNAGLSGSTVTQIPAKSVGDKIFYGDFERIALKVTFDSNGGSAVDPGEVTVYYGDTVDKPENPEKDDFFFGGWFQDLSSDTPFDFTQGITGNVTLHAKWLEGIPVTFETDGGTPVSAQGVEPGGKAVRPESDPTKTGYTFKGWFKDPDCQQPFEFNTEVIDVATTVYAKWQVNKYTITFDSDGGSNVGPIEQDYDTAITPPENPTKDGFIFNTWEPALPEKMPEGGLTVKAKWKRAPSLATDKTEYFEGEAINVTAFCENGGAWVGLYEENVAPAEGTSTAWYSLPDYNDKAFNILKGTVNKGIVPGKYKVMLFEDENKDGNGNYVPIDKLTKEITIKEDPNPTSGILELTGWSRDDKTRDGIKQYDYYYGDDISVKVNDGVNTEGAWVGVYDTGDVKKIIKPGDSVSGMETVGTKRISASGVEAKSINMNYVYDGQAEVKDASLLPNSISYWMVLVNKNYTVIDSVPFILRTFKMGWSGEDWAKNVKGKIKTELKWTTKVADGTNLVPALTIKRVNGHFGYDESGKEITEVTLKQGKNPLQENEDYFITLMDKDGKVVTETKEPGTYTVGITFQSDEDQYNFSCSDPDKNGLKDTIKYTLTKTADEHVINYVLNGGKNSEANPETYQTGTEVKLQAPTRTGYIFDGWFTTSDFRSGTEIETIPASAKENYTLYAKWIDESSEEVTTYSISYVLNGGENDIANPDKYTGRTEITINPAKKSGSTFGGWFFDAAFTQPADTIPKGTTGDLTLYAKFTESGSEGGGTTTTSYKITTDVTGGTISGNKTVKEGESCTVSYEPNEGYVLESVNVDGKEVDKTAFASSYTFENVTADHTINVTYVKAGSVVTDGYSAVVGGSRYRVVSASGQTAALIKAKNLKKITVPSSIKLADGKTYKVIQIDAKAFSGKKIRTVTIGKNVKKIAKYAFKGCKAKTVTIKTKKLKKSSVKGAFKSSKVKTVKVKVGSKKVNKKYVKKYKKIFTKKNAGKKVKVK